MFFDVELREKDKPLKHNFPNWIFYANQWVELKSMLANYWDNTCWKQKSNFNIEDRRVYWKYMSCISEDHNMHCQTRKTILVSEKSG